MTQPQRTIVILDNCPEDRATYRRYLLQDCRYDYPIWEGESGPLGWALCERVKPDAIFLALERAAAEEVLRVQEWRARSQCRDSCIIFLTARGTATTDELALEANTEDCLSKENLTASALLRALDGVLEGQRWQRSSRQSQVYGELSANLARQFIQGHSLREILESTVIQLRELLGCDRAFIYSFPSPENPALFVESVSAACPSLSSLRPTFDEESLYQYINRNFCQEVRSAREIEALAGSPRDRDGLERLQVKAHLSIPLLLGPETRSDTSPEQPWGVIVAQQCSRERTWQTQERKWLEHLALQLSLGWERTRTRERLKQERRVQKHLSLLVESAADFMGIADVEGNFLWMSDRGRSLLGLPHNAPSALCFAECHPPSALEALRTRGLPAALREGRWTEENTLLALDGRELQVSETIIAHTNALGEVEYFTIILHDISDRKRVESQLHLTNERFKLAARAVRGIIYDWDIETDTVERTEGQIQLLGCRAEEVEPTRHWWNRRIHPDDLTRIREEVRDVFAPGNIAQYAVEYRIQRQDGESVYVLDCGIVLRDARGFPLRAVGTIKDISQDKQAELDLQDALERQRESNTLKSRFVSMVSHEFRNPLNSISGIAQMLELYEDRLSPTKKKELFVRMHKGIERMIQLLDDVLIIGRADSGKLQFKPTLLNLEKFCRGAIGEVQIEGVETSKIQFSYRGEPEANLDEKLLRHILVNLLSNALKYSPDPDSVSLEAICDRTAVILKVVDRGIGIPLEDRRHLFGTFHRASNVGAIKGTGLGLAIVKQCVELHGGEIEVTSEVGKGTTFTVTIPHQKKAG